MNAITLGEDIFFHTRMPAARLVTEMGSGFEKFLYINGIWQVVSLSN
jgi:hypothetical protein